MISSSDSVSAGSAKPTPQTQSVATAAAAVALPQEHTKGTALITGGAVRLGKAMMLGLAEAGYRVALHYHSSQAAAIEAAEEARAFGVECELFPFDLVGAANVADLIDQVRSQFPDLNVLVNSASVYDPAPILATDPGLLAKQFKLNFEVPYFLTQAFARSIQAAGTTGSVVNLLDSKIGSNHYHYSAYLLSKKALAEFTKMAAIELAPAVRTNGIAPGVILPVKSRTSDYVQWRVNGIPLKRQGSTRNIVQALHYLLANDFINGQILVVDGGESVTNIEQNAVIYEETYKVKQ